MYAGARRAPSDLQGRCGLVHGKTFRLAIACVCASAGLALAAPTASVSFLGIPSVPEFPDAAEPGAIQYACAEQESALASLYAEKGLRLNPALLRPIDGHALCHIYYEPTLPGFRISAEQQPVDELYASVDSLSFLAGREAIGDSSSVLTDVAPLLSRPPRLTISVSGGFPEAMWDNAVERQLPGFRRLIDLRSSGSDLPHLWGQDHLKSGEVDGSLRILVPRRLYEGRNSDGETFLPVLDRLRGDRYIRSKLSWEGGDLMAIVPPAHPDRTMLLHGLAASRYWGTPLQRAEYAWVLRTEFGADSSMDLGGLAPHADYVVSFLPEEPIVIVAQPRFGNSELVGAAAAFLENVLGERAPPAVRELLSWIRERGARAFENTDDLRMRIAAARSETHLLDLAPPAELEADLDAYMAQHCTGDPEACFLGAGKLRMLNAAPDLLRRSLDAASRTKMSMDYLPRMLNLIEGQIPGVVDKDPRSFDALAAGLAGLGYRVERLPFFLAASPGEGEDPWPGVSYINLLAMDRRIVLPALGLGEVERAIVRELAETLGPSYAVALVDARAALASNGGVHCVFGMIRRPREKTEPQAARSEAGPPAKTSASGGGF